MGSSGRPVAQSITVWIPTKVAGIVSGLLRSAYSTKKNSGFSSLLDKSKDCEVNTYINNGSAPITEEISGSWSWSDQAPNVITFI